jgi:hypothetical protein
MNINDICIGQEYRMNNDTKWMHSGYETLAIIVDINLELGIVRYEKRTSTNHHTQEATKFLSNYVLILTLDEAPRPPISEIYAAPENIKIEDAAFNAIFFTPIFNCIHLFAAVVVVLCLLVAK